ncbi:MAG: hypothetical protein KTR18_10130 [Acidiferrobacterales bacterium]|nr:hypothetical protein [Acidiferrobacterales bacterium]
MPATVEHVFHKDNYHRTWLTVGLVVLFVILFVWQITGLLRTGDAKTRETGERLWSTGIQVLLVVSVLFVIARGVGVFQQAVALSEEARLSAFSFSRNYQFSVDLEKKIVQVVGLLDPGVTRELDTLLSNTPDIRVIELQSEGGQIYEGRGLYQLIKRRNLDTVVIKRCHSACTVAFLGGKERQIGPDAEIGFHQYKTHSIQPNINVQKEQTKDRDLMLSQGVNQAFVDKVFSAAPEDIWIPGHEELFVAGVITNRAGDW